MHTSFSFLCALVVVVVPLAAQQSSRPTPVTSDSWMVTGAKIPGVFSGSDLNLPAGAQLVRSVTTDSLTLSFVSKPVIGENPDAWPVLEIGDAALVFHRADSVGKLALVVGENPSIELPGSFPLDGTGRSNVAVQVTVVRKGANLSVIFADQIMQFPIKLTSGFASEVVFSAGVSAAWPLEDVELSAGSSDLTDVNQTDGKKSPGQPGTTASNFGKSLGGRATLFDQSSDKTSEDTDRNLAPEVAAATGNSLALEIFTPPAFRFGKAESARSATAKSQNR